MLDPADPIAPLQSATIRAAIGIIVVKAITLFGLLGVSSGYLAFLTRYQDWIVEGTTDCIIICLAIKVIWGRINATETIKKG